MNTLKMLVDTMLVLWNNSIMMKKCPCGNTFPVVKSRESRTKYCCLTCFYKYRTRPSGLAYKKHKENPTSFKKGQKPWNYGAGIPYLDSYTGYVYISIKGRKIKYHRYIMENHLKRKLKPHEVVHHKDFNKTNNSLDNLEVMHRGAHIRLHHALRRKQI